MKELKGILLEGMVKMNETAHIVKSFDGDLKHLNDQIVDMGKLVIQQIEDAVTSITDLNIDLANKVVQKDPEIDNIEHEIDSFAIRTIALRQPVARDLRAVIAALKVSSHLERIADYATNIAKRTATVAESRNFSTDGQAVPRMIRHAIEMIQEVLEAYVNQDDKKAESVWKRDVELDQMYMGYVRELLTYMMEDPRNISACTQFLFIAKNIERIGDHTTNIAELVHYLISGHAFDHPRPKGKGEQKFFGAI